MAIVESKKLPASPRGAVNAGKTAIGYGWFFALLAAGFGVFLLALPWLARAPIIGGVFAQGAQVFPSVQAAQSNGGGTNRYGVRYP